MNKKEAGKQRQRGKNLKKESWRGRKAGRKQSGRKIEALWLLGIE